jgi:hypothetical protein
MRPQAATHPDPDVVYHKATLAHMQLCPLAISTEMLDRLNARDRDIGVRFPGALREWYALADAWSDLWWYIFVNRHGDSSLSVAERPFGRPDPDGPDPSSWIYPATAAEIAWKPHAPRSPRSSSPAVGGVDSPIGSTP